MLKRRNGLEYIKNQKDDEKEDSPTTGPCHRTGPVVQSPHGRLLLFPEPVATEPGSRPTTSPASKGNG